MSVMGFPNERELSSMFGFVTDEDREKWDRMKAASDRQLEADGGRVTARGLAEQTAAPGISFAAKKIEADLRAASNEERRNTLGKQTKRTITTLETEEPVKFDGTGLGY
jgi:hypothetical protein